MTTNTYQLGLVSISFRQHSPKEIIQAVKDAGLTCIEWGSDVHAPPKDIAKLQEIANLQAMYGITCSSYGTYFRLGHTPIEELPAYIQAAKILGTRILRLWCGTQNGQDMTPEAKAHLWEQCRQAAHIAQENDVILCMECHHGTFTQYPQDAVDLMQNLNSPHFQMYWQPFQWLDTQGSFAVATAVAPYTHHVHVFNWAGDNRYPLADGLDAWRTYLTVLPAPRALLLEFMPDDKLTSLRDEAYALQCLVNEVR